MTTTTLDLVLAALPGDADAVDAALSALDDMEDAGGPAAAWARWARKAVLADAGISEAQRAELVRLAPAVAL